MAQLEQGMQPQTRQTQVQQGTKFQPIPNAGVPYSPEVISRGGMDVPNMVSQTQTTQPNLLEVLAKLSPKYPGLVSQQAQTQSDIAKAATLPWMETPRGGMRTNAITGETKENPFVNAETIKPSVNQKIGLNQKTGKWEWFDIVERDGTTKWNPTGVEAKEPTGSGERPYFQTVVDRDGAVKVFDTRTGKFVESPNDVIKAAPTEVRMFVSALDNNLSSIKKIREISDIGDLTGVVSGRARKFGTRFFSDEEAQKLRSRVGQLRTIIYGLSGKQINESEQKWLYDEILPNMSNPTENFEVALDEFENWVKTKKGELIKQFPNIKDIQTDGTNPPPTGTGKFKILKVE
jgi:hypothetical protein